MGSATGAAEKSSAASQTRTAREDLAAAHRLAVIQGFSEGIYNHFTLLVPGTRDRFFCIPFGLHWAEVTASSLMTVGLDGQVLDGEGEVERSAICIHAPIHELVPHAACVLHTHTPFASALTRLEEQHVRAIGQTEVSLINAIAYDEAYNGFARDPAEGRRLAALLSPGKHVLFMANHGVVVLGRSVAEAYDRLYYLERACQSQLYAMWTGQKLRYIPQETIEQTSKQFDGTPTYYGRPNYELHFEALKRLLGDEPRAPYFA